MNAPVREALRGSHSKQKTGLVFDTDHTGVDEHLFAVDFELLVNGLRFHLVSLLKVE
jgi:hypothetical protein